MKQFKFNKLAVRLAGGGLVGLVMAAQSAMACTVDNWDANSNGATPGSVVADSPTAISRYSGLCGMNTAASTVGWVQDNSPAGINRIRARFYVLADQTSDAIIYRGLNGSNAEIFRVLFRAGGLITFASSGATASAPGNIGDWNSIEIDWNADAGQMSLSVNGQPAVTSPFSSAQTVSSVRLGNLNAASGTLSFDAYESRRSTEIGRLCVGDADNNGERGISDLDAIFNEFQFDNLAAGQPDADEDGDVGISDLNTVFQIFQFGTPACPSP